MGLINFAYKVYRKLFCNQDVYIHKIKNDAPWALVAYIPFVFYHKGEEEFLDRHQSLREALVIDNVLISLGYNVYHVAFGSEKALPNLDFKLIFGLEPNFCKACKKYPHAKKIYYATGAYCGHQNQMVKNLTDGFNLKYSSQIPYRRLVMNHEGAQLADSILQIGSCYTKQTYPIDIRHKIHLIHQSSQAVNTVSSINYAKGNEYFFMSSSGNILRGVPQMIETFSSHPELTLHIVGPMEEDVLEILQNLITPQIVIHGFLNINSSEFLSIVARCNFIIYPSGSEGGVPGAVINAMKNGLIPITTRWSSFDDIQDVGYMMQSVSTEDIERGIQWSLNLTEHEVLQHKRRCVDYISEWYNLNRFEREFRTYIEKEISV